MRYRDLMSAYLSSINCPHDIILDHQMKLINDDRELYLMLVMIIT